MKKLIAALALLTALSMSILADDGNMGATFTSDPSNGEVVCGNMGATYTGDPCTEETSETGILDYLAGLFS